MTVTLMDLREKETTVKNYKIRYFNISWLGGRRTLVN